MKKYELLLVLPGTLDEKEAENRAQEVVNLVKENSTEAELHNLGKSRLAYPIKQIRYGYFYTVVFAAEPAGLKVVQEKITLARDLLRAMITHFNTNLTAAQKIAYTTDELGITTMAPKEETGEVRPHRVEDAKKVDLADINKKLDEILEGDVLPGV